MVFDWIDDLTPLGRRSPPLTGLFGSRGFEERPLGLGEAGVVGSDFHRSNRAELRMKRAWPSPYVKSFAHFFPLFIDPESIGFQRQLKHHDFSDRLSVLSVTKRELNLATFVADLVGVFSRA